MHAKCRPTKMMFFGDCDYVTKEPEVQPLGTPTAVVWSPYMPYTYTYN
jgi:hypothetical protein